MLEIWNKYPWRGFFLKGKKHRLDCNTYMWPLFLQSAKEIGGLTVCTGVGLILTYIHVSWKYCRHNKKSSFFCYCYLFLTCISTTTTTTTTTTSAAYYPIGPLEPALLQALVAKRRRGRTGRRARVVL